MNQIEKSRYDNALNQLKKELGTHEDMARKLNQLELHISTSTIWRWFVSRNLPAPYALALVELATNNHNKRLALIRPLIPYLAEYLSQPNIK